MTLCPDLRRAPREVIKSVNGVDRTVEEICAALFQAKSKIKLKIVRVNTF